MDALNDGGIFAICILLSWLYNFDHARFMFHVQYGGIKDHGGVTPLSS